MVSMADRPYVESVKHETKTVVVIGASGTIGQAVADALQAEGHEVLRASRSGPLAVDLEDAASVEAMFDEVGPVDAVVSTAGRASFGELNSAPDEAFELSVRSKLMGQVNLVRIAAKRLAPSASITLTTGILGEQPGPGTVAVAMVNAGLEGFVRGAAQDLPNGPRVNAVSPPFVLETALEMGMGRQGMPARQVAAAYVAAVNDGASGTTLHPS